MSIYLCIIYIYIIELYIHIYIYIYVSKRPRKRAHTHTHTLCSSICFGKIRPSATNPWQQETTILTKNRISKHRTSQWNGPFMPWYWFHLVVFHLKATIQTYPQRGGQEAGTSAWNSCPTVSDSGKNEEHGEHGRTRLLKTQFSIC